MKGFIITIAILVGLILFSMGVSHKLEGVSNSLLDKTENIYSSVSDKDYEGASMHLDKAKKEFKSNKILLEATGNHEEILRIEIAFDYLNEFIEAEQNGDALSVCNELSILLKHLTGNFKLKAENIL